MFHVSTDHAADQLMVALHALTKLSALDLVYADQYLYRAETLLPQVITRDEYLDLRRARDALARATHDIRQAIGASDWSRVRTLAESAAHNKTQVTAREVVRELADAVYGPRFLQCDPKALAMTGVLAQPATVLDSARAAIIGHLQGLAAADRPWADFYQSRASYFERLQVVAEERRAIPTAGIEREKQLLAAVASGDFAEVERLTDAIVSEGHRKTPGRVRVPAADDLRLRALSASYPSAAARRSRDLGLGEEAVSAAPELNSYLSCACGQRPSFPETPLSETNRVSRGCTCGHCCPPEIGPALRQSLDWLLIHPFMSSVGTRYLPWFSAETVLVETFPETEPDARTPLLDALSLSSRRGLSRVTIEDVLRSKGPHLCADLGLDPFEFVVACIPFDVYLRLAARHGWGQQRLWTHFDGYQVAEETGAVALALVGGDAGYGGADDLCAVQRDYEAERITTRFCIVRRARFLARQSQAVPSGSQR